MIGLTVGETSDPQKNLKSNQLSALAYSLFYRNDFVDFICCSMALFRFKESPLVTAASDPLPRRSSNCQSNDLVASLSSANSAVYSTSRILYQTAKKKFAPLVLCAF